MLSEDVTTLAQGIRTAAIMGLMAFLSVGCLKTADLIDATLMTAILSEDFEAPIVQVANRYHSGQSFITAAGTWKVTAGVVELMNVKSHPDIAVFDGSQALYMASAQAGGRVATSFTTVPKKQYTLTFHFARHRLADRSIQGRVEILGAEMTLLEGIFSHEEEAFDSYRRYSGTFTADSPQTTLCFTVSSPSTYGMTLDGIKVWLEPPPLPARPPVPGVR